MSKQHLIQLLQQSNTGGFRKQVSHCDDQLDKYVKALLQLLQVYFRSDKANMQPEEIAAKQQQASELQDELKKQIEAKKRIKVHIVWQRA